MTFILPDIGLIYSLLTANTNRLPYVFQGSNPILPLSIQSGVLLIEIFKKKKEKISQIRFILVSGSAS